MPLLVPVSCLDCFFLIFEYLIKFGTSFLKITIFSISFITNEFLLWQFYKIQKSTNKKLILSVKDNCCKMLEKVHMATDLGSIFIVPKYFINNCLCLYIFIFTMSCNGLIVVIGLFHQAPPFFFNMICLQIIAIINSNYLLRLNARFFFYFYF